MKLLSLKIQGYKNLKDKTKASFNFENCTNYVALIGLNGSGKSNILEAISIIFSSLYQGRRTVFDDPKNSNYEIVYELNGDIISIIDDIMTVKGKRIKKDNHIQFLPTNVITSYSGEELRMWGRIYFPSYSTFFKDIKNSTDSVPNMLYINKYAWEFALLTLLSSEKPQVKDFIKNVLCIDPSEVSIEFDFKSDNIGTYPKNKAISFIETLIELQKKSDGKLILNQINSINPDALSNDELSKRLFYNLFITGMPDKRENSKYNTDKIIRRAHINFNDIDVERLSEGEKKLILMHCITNILADEKTLVLLDEPDAHVHIERKKELIEIIDQPNHFTIFTTHSPTILHCIKEENVRIIKNSDNIGLEAIYLDKLMALENLTKGEFSFIDATLVISSKRPLLLVEGKGDVAYIYKAINVLNQQSELDIDILPFGGTDNAKEFVDEIKKCVHQEKQIIVLFDRDEAGAKGMKKCVNFTQGKGNASTYKKDDIAYLMLPIQAGHTGSDFLIEDYFSIEKKNAIATKCITDTNGSFNDFPKDLKQRIKDNLSNEIDTYTAADLVGFQVLLDKLKSIIQGTEAFENDVVNQPGN